MEWNEVYGRVAGFLVDKCRQHLITFLIIFLGLILAPLWCGTAATKGCRWILSCAVGFVLLQLILVDLLKWDEVYGTVAGFLVDKCLQYPITFSLIIFLGFFCILAPLWYGTAATKGHRWILSCAVGFVLLPLILVGLVPTLHVTAPRIIFRPTPSCSTFDNPARYICSILINHQQQFYITTKRKCDPQDQNFENATNFYIISSWIPSFNHYITKRKVNFEPAVVPGEVKKSYHLPDNYCVHAAGPTSQDKLKVAFYSHKGTLLILEDTGYINKTDLLEFQYGWYYVSSCRTDLERWWYSNCKTGYVSSHYVTLSEYSRSLLLEKRGDEKIS